MLLRSQPRMNSLGVDVEFTVARRLLLRPKPMGQQVRKADKFFPVCGSVGEPVIEPAIDYQIAPHGIRERPEITCRIRIKIRLGKMPDFTGNCELL